MSFLDFLSAAGPIISGAGAAIGGIASANAQTAANEANIGLAREQMAFQERMSNSAYQRATDDMRKAGINPMVAFSQGGASTPPGAMAEVAPASPVTGLGDALKASLSTAVQAAELKKGFEEKDANIKLATAAADTKKTEAILNSSSAKMNDKNLQVADAQIKKIKADTVSSLLAGRGQQLTNMKSNLEVGAVSKEVDARMKEAELRYSKAAWEKDANDFDQLLRRVDAIAGMAGKAVMGGAALVK